jgi:fermentation-respiration switch protein FrsA (DUF1100 family)
MIIYIIILAIVIIITIGLIQYFQNKVTYYPNKLDSNYNFHLKRYKKNLRKQIDNNVTIKEYNINSNNNTINLIYFNNPETTNLMIYAHGNAENITSHMDLFYKFGKMTSIILFDYSGYGKSTGPATTKAICQDIYNVWTFATKKLKVKPENIILYGFSLGGAVTSYLLYKLYTQKQRLPKAIIIQSSFTNSKHMAKQILSPYLYHATKFFIDNTFNSIEYLEKLNNKLKIMIIHSPDDEIINYQHAELFLKKIKCDHIVINGTHNKPKFTEEFWEVFISYL